MGKIISESAGSYIIKPVLAALTGGNTMDVIESKMANHAK